MRYALLLAFLVGRVFSLTPEQCDQALGDEVEYTCRVDNATVTLASRKNDYVRIYCEGGTISCADLPRFDFASNLSLKSLGVHSCSPRILRCVKDVITATALEVVTLSNMSGTVTREDVEALGAVRVFMMQLAASEKSLPIDAIKSLPSLRDLRIGGGDFQLSPNVFQGSPPLKYLELSKDNITSIPEDSFQGLASLNELNLWGNDIHNISASGFKGLTSLTRLTLNTNKLRHIEAGSFTTMPMLATLVMTANELVTLPNGLLGGLNGLENITIQMNRNELKLDTQAFSQLPSLKNLIIKYSDVTQLPSELFTGSENITSIDLTNNKIDSLPSKVFVSLNKLIRLDLSFNKIQDLPSGLFAGLKMLEYLNLNRNLIQSLSDHLFSGPTHLKEVHIDHNAISTIAWTTFQGVPNLQKLSLASNKLTLESETQNYMFLDSYTPSPFQAMTKLRKLNLSGNEIRTIFYDWQALMFNLEVLDLSWNHFKSLEFGNQEIAFLSKSLVIDLRHNRLQHVILDPPQSVIEDSDPSTTILLDDNPIICDCSTYGLRLRANGTRYTNSEPKFILDNARCTSPANLKGKVIRNLTPDSFICELPDQIPDKCSKCTANVARNELIIDCQDMPSKLPDTKSNAISYYFIKEPTVTLNLEQQPKSLRGENVHKVNLSNAGIEELTFSPSEQLKVLDLSHNKLRSIPTDFLQSDIELYLSGNPIECECWYTENIAALLKYNFLADLPQITCTNGEKIAKIDVTALCNTWKASMAAVGTFLTLGILVLTLSVLVYRYSNEILIYMTTRGLCKCCITEVFLDKDKEYDIFISFAHQDHEMVQNELLPKLENEFKQKVCVHYRDWIVGDLIPTQIVKSVENSRKTIIILSKNFLESVWANLEFCAAHNLALQDGKARIILILLDENISKNDTLSEELKAYISTNTYLLYGDPKFWEKLHKVLPKIEHKFTWIEALKHRHTITDKISSGLDVKINSDGKLVNVGKNVEMSKV